MRVEPSRGRDLRVGRYAIQGEIATGGMATVHYGRLVGPAGFSRGVAIKRLHGQYAKDPDFVAMFLDEARLASRILHPNVVPILDVVADGGELFLVMEFVPGEALSKLFKRTPEGVPLSIASAIAVGMLEGLHAAHEARGEDGTPLSIVHRDVSPQNVLVGLDGVARLIDFGVAKATGNATMTRDGQVKGKVAYMAPEQIRAEKIDRRADIYAASVVLWEMLTGKRFFAEAESDAARVLLALNAEIPPPSSIRPELKGDLDAIVMRGLARKPEDRFGSAREMAQAMERVSTPAAARDVGRWVEAKAGEALWLRSQRMSEFDLSIATELPGKASPRVLEPTTVTAPTAAGLSDVSGSFTKPDEPSVKSTRSKPGWFVALAIVAAGGIGFSAARLMAVPAPTSQSLVAAFTPVRPGGTASEVISAKVSEPPPSAEPTAVTNASSSTKSAPAGVSSHGSPRSTSAPPSPPPRGPAPSPSAKPGAKPGCSPPFIITPDGVREYKPECLK